MDDHILSRLIGKRFRIIAGNHPHKGCHGKIVRIEETDSGIRPVMELDGEDCEKVECVIMNSRQVAIEIRGKKK